VPIRSSRAGRVREDQIEDLDADMFVAFEGVGGAEHDQHGEHVPLQFEPAVGAVAKA